MQRELVSRFIERASLVGAVVRRAGRSSLAGLFPNAIAGTSRARAEIREITWRTDVVPRQELADIVAFAPLAVAETGSVLLAEPAPDRGLCLLADRLTVFVRAETIVPSLAEALAEAGRLSGSGNHHLSFLSGPSRTGDIERVLTTGVHGPGTLTIIVLEEEG